LQERIEALGLTDRVRLVGSQPARAVFGRGRVAVLPSLAESLPYVVLEATAAQLPVVTTCVGGIPEIFAGTAETLVAPGDAAALAAAMQAALDRPDLMQAEMQTRLKRVASEFSLDTMVGRIEALYRDVQGKG
jgi:glycosyltransferase involved in cell wall biosynthesis